LHNHNDKDVKTSTKRILSIGFAALCLIAAFIVYGSLIRPELGIVADKRDKNASQENLFENQKAAVASVQQLLTQFKSFPKLQENVSLAMPVGESTTEALNQWQAIVRTSNVGVRSFSLKPLALQPASKNEPLTKRLGILEMNTTVDGSYEGIKSFLRYLETNIRIANTKSISVTPIIGSLGDRYSLALTVEMYYQEP